MSALRLSINEKSRSAITCPSPDFRGSPSSSPCGVTIAVQRPITGVDVPLDAWAEDVLTPVGLPAHLQQHLATMARLHREGRYDRATKDVEELTGRPALTVAQYITENPQLFS
jgi:hypothetical protein